MTTLAQPPLATLDDAPVLYEVLGAVIHLEKLALTDRPAIDAFNERVLAWLGPHLKRTWAPFLRDVGV